MAVTIGLDFGCGSTEIYGKGKGIVLREPSVAAVDTEGNVIAAGVEALLIRGRAPGSVTLRRPMRDSVISDFNLCAELLDRFLELAAPHHTKQVVIATNQGEPVVGEDCVAGRCYEKVCRRLLGEEIPVTDFSHSPGLLEKISGFFHRNQEG